MQTDEILKHIFEGKHPDPSFEGWVKSSKRFKAFAETYRNKLRKKIRNAQDQEGLKDVFFEFEIAFLLLQESRFTLEYETYRDQRGPDFTITFKTHTPFNVEARRIRALDSMNADQKEAVAARLMDAVCDKVKQLPTSIVNILAFTSSLNIHEQILVEAMVELRKLAENKSEMFFIKRGFGSAADFIRQYHRLSGVLYIGGNALFLWTNPLAKHPVPREIANGLTRLSPAG